MNEGKRFETDFKNSVPKDILCYRIPDPMESFSKIKDGLRFTLKNPCDFFVFDNEHGKLLALEMKTTKETSLSFWRKDFEKEDVKRTFMIRKNQIEGLEKFSKYNDMVCGFVINFRLTNHTYFWNIADFLKFSKETNKKSFNEADVYIGNGLRINQELLKVHYRYDVEAFLEMVNELY